jgi:hypothetical protein
MKMNYESAPVNPRINNETEAENNQQVDDVSALNEVSESIENIHESAIKYKDNLYADGVLNKTVQFKYDEDGRLKEEFHEYEDSGNYAFKNTKKEYSYHDNGEIKGIWTEKKRGFQGVVNVIEIYDDKGSLEKRDTNFKNKVKPSDYHRVEVDYTNTYNPEGELETSKGTGETENSEIETLSLYRYSKDGTTVHCDTAHVEIYTRESMAGQIRKFNTSTMMKYDEEGRLICKVIFSKEDEVEKEEAHYYFYDESGDLKINVEHFKEDNELVKEVTIEHDIEYKQL